MNALIGCSACNYTTSNLQSLNVHRQFTGHGCFRCRECKATYARLEDMNWHLSEECNNRKGYMREEQRLHDASSVVSSGRPRLFHTSHI
jgi:hypothetical protein